MPDKNTDLVNLADAA